MQNTCFLLAAYVNKRRPYVCQNSETGKANDSFQLLFLQIGVVLATLNFSQNHYHAFLLSLSNGTLST